MSKTRVSSEPVYISISEASQRFGYKRGSIYLMIKNGKASSKTVNDRMYVSVSDLEKRFEAFKPRIVGKRKKLKTIKPVVRTEVREVKEERSNIEVIIFTLAIALGILSGYIIATLTR